MRARAARPAAVGAGGRAGVADVRRRERRIRRRERAAHEWALPPAALRERPALAWRWTPAAPAVWVAICRRDRRRRLHDRRRRRAAAAAFGTRGNAGRCDAAAAAVTASCCGGGACGGGGCGSGKMAYFANSACALASILPPSTLCSFISFSHAVDDRLGRLAPMRDRFRQQRDDDVAALDHRSRRPHWLEDPTSCRPCRPRADPNCCRSRLSDRAAADRKPACSSPDTKVVLLSDKSENSVCVLRRSLSRNGGTMCQGSTQPSTTCSVIASRKLRARHRHGLRAEHAHRLAGKPRLHMQFQILDILDRAHRRD